MIVLSAVCLAYLLGSIPTGLLAARWTKGVDIRLHGSGNVGATNVARVVGKIPGAFVLAVDVAKGWVPVALIAGRVSAMGVHLLSPESLRVLLGVVAVAGHIWNPFLQFRGGKGVATALGVLLGLDPVVGVSSVGIWIVAALFTRYVSVASVSAGLGAAILMAWLGRPTSRALGTILVALWIAARHRPNFLRLLHGEEHRIGKS